MNTKIFALITKNLHAAFDLPKYADIAIDRTTVVDQLPWTPARFRKFKTAMEKELNLDSDYAGTVESIVTDLDTRYSNRFFGEMWQPRTDDYNFTGWQLVDEINGRNPRAVLDVGCGYHPFKNRIHNLVGIDPYNHAAEYQVDVLEYRVAPGSYDCVIALGSINFNSRADIEQRFAHCVDLLAPGGRFYLRANPGISHKAAPYVDIFPWTFEVVNQLAEKYRLRLETFQKDANDRLYFVYTKL